VEDAIGDHRRHDVAPAEKQRSEGAGADAEETEAARAVGMGRQQVKVEARRAPQELAPQEDAVVPADEHELEEGQAELDVALAGQRPRRALGRLHGVPGFGPDTELLPPEAVTRAEDERDQGQLDRHGAPQPGGRGDDRLEAGAVLGTDDALLDEESQGWSKPAMDHDLGCDEQGESEEETCLRFQVLHEWECDSRHGLPLEGRQDEERQPGQQREGQDPPPQEIEGRSEQPAAQEELVQRPAQDEREVAGVCGFHGLQFGWPTHEYCHAAEAIL
jgi:hypothetical protein